MTKATGAGRGGKRAGAGRKPKAPAASVIAPTGMTPEALAKHYAALAVETLAKIAADGAQPAGARVAASREILDRAEGKARSGAPQPDEADAKPADNGWGNLLDTPTKPARRAN